AAGASDAEAMVPMAPLPAPDPAGNGLQPAVATDQDIAAAKTEDVRWVWVGRRRRVYRRFRWRRRFFWRRRRFYRIRRRRYFWRRRVFFHRRFW
ncbi:MAG TPA: hypothetical protein VG271_05130, partial [Beijerinckiaceae bacterium]|nr:hypothetical protein [Beijerinckiaceae bacterium]